MKLCSHGCGQPGIYFSKQNKKWRCEKSSNQCPELKRKNKERSKNNKFTIHASLIKRKCKYCNKEVACTGLKRHETQCYLNPDNTKPCPVCNKAIKNYRKSKTCSYSCANTFFRTGKNHGNWTENPVRYQTVCFRHHEHKCIICSEEKIVAVHHFDENNKNNDPTNLIPMCPNHHFYIHSRYKKEVVEQVNQYQKNFSENFNK